MAFTLKKILSAFLMPLSIGLLILALGLWFLYTQSYKKAKFYLSVGFLWIFMISYGPFSNALIEPLENQYSKIDSKIHAKYILLLGGDFENRAFEAIRLYYAKSGSKIITSGYPGASKSIPEAVSNANKLISLGIPKENILMQIEPKDTAEEAKYIKKIVKNEPFILVTSAHHMPRAMALFKKEGLSVIPAPANLASRTSSVFSLPHGANLRKTEIATHEYLGLLWNKIKELL